METASLVASRVLDWALTLSIPATVSFLLLVTPARSQNTNGMISGTITDASDAVVPGAQLPLTQAAHGITLRTTSEMHGAYSFPNLEPGHRASAGPPNLLQFVADIGHSHAK